MKQAVAVQPQGREVVSEPGDVFDQTPGGIGIV